MPQEYDAPHASAEAGEASSGMAGYGDPYRRLPPPGTYRIKINPAQQAFHWAESSAAAERTKPNTPMTAPPATSAESTGVLGDVSPKPSAPSPPPSSMPTAQQLGAASPALLKVKRPFKEVVERYLRDNGIDYLAVDEAKRALFGGAKLRSFHFVVYRTPQKNWLLHTAQLRKDVRQNLREWEVVFGDGFMAVVAKQMSDGSLKFQTLAGDIVDIK